MKIDRRAINQALAMAKKKLEDGLDEKACRKELAAGRELTALARTIAGKKQYCIVMVLRVVDRKPK